MQIYKKLRPILSPYASGALCVLSVLNDDENDDSSSLISVFRFNVVVTSCFSRLFLSFGAQALHPSLRNHFLTEIKMR